MTTSNLATNRANNARRKVFYDYPTGKFPLMGLLSLMDDEEELTDYELGWYEEKWKSARDLTAIIESGKGPFATSAAGTAAAANATAAVGATIYVKLVNADDIRVRDVIMIKDVLRTDATTANVTGWVTAIDDTANVATVKLLDASLASVGASNQVTTNNGKYVTVIGTATGEGDRSRSDGRSTEPLKLTNVTQIFRTVLGPWTGSALKMGQQWDSKPKYFKDCKDGSLRHMTSMEKALLFGVKRETTTTNADGDSVPVRFAGGIRWYLEQWDKGNTANGGAYDYRPGESDLSSATWTSSSSEDKRVLTNVGTVTKSNWDELIRRMFMSQSDSTYEKLVVCGDKTLAVINDYANRNSLTMHELSPKEDSYGMQIKRLNTIHGDLLFKTHPLFKEDPSMQNTMVVLDAGDLKYHNMEGRDTELLKNRQARDADYRKDEWLTECTFEIRMPRRHMWIDGLTGILS